MEKFLRKLLKENWYKHFLVALLIQVLISHYFEDFAELRLFERLPVAAIFWYLINWIFEWFQKNIYKTKAGMKTMHYDSLAAMTGGVTAVIIYSII
jgi:hypothetical protein